MTLATRVAASLTFLAALGVVGCSDSTGTGGTRPVSLSFTTRSQSPLTSSGARFAITSGPLVITKAQLVLSKTELERADVSCDGASEDDDDSCPDLQFGPMLVDLPLDATARTMLAVNVPAGSYEEFEAEIDAVSSESEGRRQESAAFLAANPQFRGVSIRVEGTYNGVPFVYTSAVEAEIELEFSPALVVDGATSNLTVFVDVASWFRRADGSTLDPVTANAGGANKNLVDENIKRSFDAFEDDDRDGRDD